MIRIFWVRSEDRLRTTQRVCQNHECIQSRRMYAFSDDDLALTCRVWNLSANQGRKKQADEEISSTNGHLPEPLSGMFTTVSHATQRFLHLSSKYVVTIASSPCSSTRRIPRHSQCYTLWVGYWSPLSPILSQKV